MEDVVGSVFDLMGRTSDPILEEEVINANSHGTAINGSTGFLRISNVHL